MKHLEVVCALIKMNNLWYCCKRGKGSLKGYWEFPGGKIEPGESKETAIIREIKEELNSIIKVNRFIGESNYEYGDIDNPFSITLYAYECILLEGDLELSEHLEARFASKEEMLKMNFAKADYPIIEML